MYRLMGDLYRPFLTDEHLESMFQFIVVLGNKPIGFLSLGKSNCIQTALSPDHLGQGFGDETIQALLQWYPLDSIGWTTSKSNVPSLSLLLRLGGGVTSTQERGEKILGRCWPGRAAPAEARDKLISIIEKAQPGYKKWVKEYESRKEEAKALRDYLKDLTLS